MSGGYYLTHAKIAELTGLSTGRVSKLGTILGKALNPYRTRGQSNAHLYDSNGLIVWQQIAQMHKRGIGPKEIEAKLGKPNGKPENPENVDPLREHFGQGRGEPEKRVGNEVIPRDLHDEMRSDFKDRDKEKKEEIKYLRDQIEELQQQTRLLPSPAEFKQAQEKAIQARTDAHKLLQELRELQKKEYGLFKTGERREDKKRAEEIISRLDELNLKH